MGTHGRSNTARLATWRGRRGVAVLERPEPGRIVLLGPDGLAVELEPLGHAWRVLWSTDHTRIPGAEILDPRALEATARAMVA